MFLSVLNQKFKLKNKIQNLNVSYNVILDVAAEKAQWKSRINTHIFSAAVWTDSQAAEEEEEEEEGSLWGRRRVGGVEVLEENNKEKKEIT